MRLFSKGNYNDGDRVLSIAELKEWIEKLPILDAPKSAVLLGQSLFRLSASDLSDKALFERLRLMYDPILVVSNAFYENFFNEAVASPYVRRAQLFYARDLHLAFADHCYNILDRDNKKLTTRLKILISHYALASYCLAILRCYQMFLLLPDGIWKKMYQIYQILEAFSSEELENLVQGEKTPLGDLPMHPFYTIILLSTINPYQLPPGEINQLYDFIVKNANRVVMHDNMDKQAIFIMDVSSDLPPIHQSFTVKDISKERLRFVDTSFLVKQLNNHDEVGDFSPHLLDKMKIAWQKVADRQFERVEDESELQLISGLLSFHHHLSELQYPSQFNKKDEQLHEPVANNDVSLNEILNHYDASVEPYSPEQFKQHYLTHWQTINRSKNGMQIINRVDCPPSQISVGLFVGLEIDKSHKWQSALIRWVQVKEQGSLCMGLQLVAEQNIPVFIQSERQRMHGYRSTAFLAKGGLAPLPTSFLITPAMPYNEGDKVILLEGKKEIEVRLKECIESTAHCKLFSFNSIEGYFSL